MRTKLFTLFLALVASVGTIFADSGKCGDKLTWDLTDGILTISGTGAMYCYADEFMSPYTAAAPWYNQRDAVTAVVINTGVTKIGEGAFRDCSNMASVTIPNSVTSMGEYAFYNCIGLTSITIPHSIKSIGYFVFSNCSSLTSVTIPDLAAWCTIAFSHEDSNPLRGASTLYVDGELVTDLVIPDGVNSIGSYAFSNCKILTSVTIPNSVTSIGSCAFENCRGLTSVAIGDSVTSIGSSAFSYCKSLTSVTIPNSVTSIGSLAFYNCRGLTSVAIPNSVTSIGSNAFQECTGLTSITIHNGVKSIGSAAFAGCTGLTSVTIPYSVKSIGYSAFHRCSNLTSVTLPKSITSIEKYTFKGCMGLTSITIPSSVTSIGDEAFCDCTGLTTVTIPNNVTSIKAAAFSGCSGLKSVTCYAIVPPSLGSSSAWPGNLSGIYVPVQSIETYKNAQGWMDFSDIIFPIGATQTQTDNVLVEPSKTTVTIVWPSVTGAETYELVIKDKSGNIICTLIFNANGQLTSIAFNAPGRNMPQQTQSAGFSFTVTGLEEGIDYNLTITAKDSNGQTLDTKSVSFTTKDAQAIDQTTSDQQSMTHKLLRNGQIYIIHGDRTYTVTGLEIK